MLKALPKSESDRREIAKLMHPEYVPAVWALLRRLGRKRLLARTLDEFLEVIYTAVVITDGAPFVVGAYSDPKRIAAEVEERKARLQRVQAIHLEPEVEEENRGENKTPAGKILEYYTLLLRELRKAGMLAKWGSHVKIKLPHRHIHIPKKYVPREALEA